MNQPGEKIRHFLEEISSLNWEPPSRAESLQKLHRQVTELVLDQIRYYSRQYQRNHRLSCLLRGLIISSGASGVLFPYWSALLPNKWQQPQLGYFLVGLAGVFYLLDEVFAVTKNYTRFILVKLQLEDLLSRTSLKWQKLFALLDPQNISDKEVSDIFFLEEDLLEKVYSQILSETGQWESLLKRQLATIKKRIGTLT